MPKHYSIFTDNYTSIYYKNELLVKGARDPMHRINSIPINFENKTVLDLGCNCGGTLFAIADKIKFGYGNDINPGAIKFANTVASENNITNLSFSVENLELWKEVNLPKTDIVFGFAIAKWISTWQEIIEHLYPETLVFEVHGAKKRRMQQQTWLENKYNVKILLEGYEDNKRAMLLCEK